MRALLINPPYQTITSNWGVGHQVPLGLLMIGGALRDAGHEVSLLDAEATAMRCVDVAREVRRLDPDVVMTGHAGSTPANALLLQGVITLVLVALSAATPDGFSAMVAYTAPVFWTFFLLTALTLFIFRRKEPDSGLRLPAAPLVGGAFMLMCAFMLWKSVAYIFNPAFGPKFGTAVLAGLVVMAIGIPLYFLQKERGAA